MIGEYVTGIAKQMGVNLTRLAFVEGRRVGCADVHLLNLACDYQTVSTLVYQSELDNLSRGSYCERLEVKIRSTLNRLQLKQES